MNEAADESPPDPVQPLLTEPAAEPVHPLPLWNWVREGLRAGILLAPRTGAQVPAPAQLVVIAVLVALLEIGLARLEVAGPAVFDLPAWLAPWWSTAVLILVGWWVLSPKVAPPAPADGPARPAGVAAWFALWLPATVPANLVGQGLSIAQAHNSLPAAFGDTWLGWSTYLLLWVWTLAVALKLVWHFVPAPRRLVAFGAALTAVFALTAWQFPGRPWQVDPSQLAQGEEEPRLELSQEVFEDQQELLRLALERLAPGRPGVGNVYGLVFAPYAREDVFLRESTLVAQLLAERFDAKGRVLQLVNHATTAGSLPWATPLNLQRAIEAMGRRMDRENDILVVYMTSHGASNFKLAADNEPLVVAPLSPGELREALDKAGIRNRVIAISACYSGGWVGPLANDQTLVMTAADATHTSYGCGRLSPLTYFGRAMFDEQLRKTFSFEKAFAAAVPLIRQREVEAGKNDGFSNPQISMGEKIRPVLEALEKRLGGPSP